MADCIFCKIIRREIPVEFLYEDDLVVAFKDKQPITPVHVLIVPKEHIASVTDFSEKHETVAGRLMMVAKNLAEKLGTAAGGYKLLLRVGRDGGQEVPHVHLHLLGGAKLTENIKPIN